MTGQTPFTPLELRAAGAEALAHGLATLQEVKSFGASLRRHDEAARNIEPDPIGEQLYSVMAMIGQQVDDALVMGSGCGTPEDRQGWMAEAEAMLAATRASVDAEHLALGERLDLASLDDDLSASWDVHVAHAAIGALEKRQASTEAAIEGIGQEVRTMRLSVVDEQGNERISASAEGGSPNLSIDGHHLDTEGAPKAQPSADDAGRRKRGRRG